MAFTEEEFDMYVAYKLRTIGHEYHCKKGLWSAYAASKEAALREAHRYFGQCWKDGEYSPPEISIRKMEIVRNKAAQEGK